MQANAEFGGGEYSIEMNIFIYAQRFKIDLWTLDALWWIIKK